MAGGVKGVRNLAPELEDMGKVTVSKAGTLESTLFSEILEAALGGSYAVGLCRI